MEIACFWSFNDFEAKKHKSIKQSNKVFDMRKLDGDLSLVLSFIGVEK